MDGDVVMRDDSQTVQWVREATTGDRGAFARLFEHIAPDLYTWAEFRIRRQLRRHLEPADLVQEVWYRAFQVIGTYDPDRVPFRLWVFRVAKNVLLESARQLGRPDQAARHGQSTGNLALQNAPDEATTVTRRLTRDEELASFIDEVRGLEEHEQELLVYCGLEGMPHKKVGERLGISAEAVSKRWQRLRKRLRR